MKIILLSLCTISILMGAGGDPQSILQEVSNLRKKYEECRASQDLKGSDSKILAQYGDKNKKLLIEINRKNGVINSLEQTMLLRDRSYRETNARNKSLIAQLHTQNVTGQEREMLKKALVTVKSELALAQKELRGGSSSIVKMRQELMVAKAALTKLQGQPAKVSTADKIVTKVVEPTEKIKALQLQLNAANSVITQLRSAPPKIPIQQPSVIYKDRIVTKQIIVYKDRPLEKVIEKVVYKDRPIEKVVTKTVIVEKSIVDENTRRKMDKLALELERAKTLNLKLTHDLAKTTVKRKGAMELPALPPIEPMVKRTAAKTVIAPAIKKEAKAVESTSSNSKKSSGVYRMSSNSSIYNAPNGRAIDTWEARRSFTGSSAGNGWIHITGYFVNRVFQGVGEGENLWVKESDAIER